MSLGNPWAEGNLALTFGPDYIILVGNDKDDSGSRPYHFVLLPWKDNKMKIKVWINRIIPLYALLPLIFEFLLNTVVYVGAKLIAGNWVHHNLETAIDQSIPFIPWTVLIYFGCYIFWIVNYILCVRQGRERTYRFLSADFLAKLICLFFFLVFPTTNTRPEITENSIWGLLMKFLYWIDSPDNLFPSIHCLTSWMCYIGIRGRKEVPVCYRLFSCLMAIAVFISTLTTKQHVIIDVAGGVLLAELCYRISACTKLAFHYGNIADKINRVTGFCQTAEREGEVEK